MTWSPQHQRVQNREMAEIQMGGYESQKRCGDIIAENLINKKPDE
jgi:hypothetical protein